MRELRQQCVDGGSTLEVVFDLRGTGLTYKTAANSAIYATNRASDVLYFAEMFNLDLDLDTTFSFTKNAEFAGKMPKMPFPTDNSMTFRQALTHHIDLTAPMSKKLLTAMIPFCEAQEDKALLEEAVKSKSTKYDEVFHQRALGLIDILTVVPSLRLTADFIFQKCNLIMPRYYTIASSSLMHPEELAIAVSLSRYEVTLPEGKKMRDGLVSGYLEDLMNKHRNGEPFTADDSVMCFVKDSTFV
mmetsp:Transcript_25768/g.34434  ORF Transcript_25768/g.34434 Transcript_25768/m.34434 type:complete len:244 (+) Transcript_25768:919-1650(+)